MCDRLLDLPRGLVPPGVVVLLVVKAVVGVVLLVVVVPLHVVVLALLLRTASDVVVQIAAFKAQTGVAAFAISTVVVHALEFFFLEEQGPRRVQSPSPHL